MMAKSIQIPVTRTGKLLFRKYRQYFLPTVLAGISTSMSVIIDSILVGNMLGDSEMAAINLCMPIIQFFFTLAVWLGMGSSTLIAINLGKRDKVTACEYFNVGIGALLFFGCIITTAGIVCPEMIALWLTDNEKLLPLVIPYLRINMIGCIPILLVPSLVYIIRTDGFVKLASFVLVLANLLNIVLDVLFMGPLQWGIEGSALATVVGFSGGVCALSAYFFNADRNIRIQMSCHLLKQFGLRLKEISRAGLPAAMGIGLVAIKLFFLNHIIDNIAGSQGLTIFSICLSGLSFMSIFISGTSCTMMPIVGVLLGERDLRGIHFVVRYSLFFSLCISTTAVLLFELFPLEIFALFGIENQPEILGMGITGLRIYALSLFGNSIAFIMMCYYQSIRNTKIANMIALFEGLLFPVPLAWIASLQLGLNGVWEAMILTEVLVFLLVYGFVWRQRRLSGNPHLSPLLIDQVAPELLAEASCQIQKENGETFIQSFSDHISKRCPGFKATAEMEGILHHFFSAIESANLGRKVLVDILFTETSDKYTLYIRDDGRPIDHTKELAEKWSSMRLTQNRLLSLNQNQIIFTKNNITNL